MKNKICLDTATDVANFVAITSKIPERIVVTDGKGMCVNAHSLLGMLYALEFDELWVESDRDIYFLIQDFIVF